MADRGRGRGRGYRGGSDYGGGSGHRGGSSQRGGSEQRGGSSQRGGSEHRGGSQYRGGSHNRGGSEHGGGLSQRGGSSQRGDSSQRGGSDFQGSPDRGGRGGPGYYRGSPDRGGRGHGRGGSRGGASSGGKKKILPRPTGKQPRISLNWMCSLTHDPRPEGVVPVPDPHIDSLKDQLAKEQASGNISSLSLVDRLPHRPSYGTEGRSVVVWANSFKLETPMALSLYRYSIQIFPEPRHPRERHQIVKLLLDSLKHAKPLASDYQSMVIGRKPLEEGDLKHNVPYTDEYHTTPDGKHTYQVALEPMRTLSVDATQVSNNDRDEILQALNIILGHKPKSLSSNIHISTKSNVHFHIAGELAKGLEFKQRAGLIVWRGFSLSVRSAQTGPLVNVQVRYKATYKADKLSTVYREFRASPGYKTHRLAGFVKGLRVERLHLNSGDGKPCKPVTITGLAQPSDGKHSPHPPRVEGPMTEAATPERVKFYCDDENLKGLPKDKYISLTDFFRLAHNIQIDPNLPVVKFGPRDNPRYLPMDQCRVLPGQSATSHVVEKDMIELTRGEPWKNAQSITEDGLKALSLNAKNECLGAFGITIGSKMETVNARVLNPPMLCYKNGSQIQPQNGGWNLIFKQPKLSEAREVGKWGVLWIGSGNPRHDLEASIEKFGEELKLRGFENVGSLETSTIVVMQASNYEKVVRAEFQKINSKNGGKDFYLVVLDKADKAASKTAYNTVKRICDLELGIRTCCVIKQRFTHDPKNNGQYYSNVILKLNAKLGGVNQRLYKDNAGLPTLSKTMLVGIDVVHPSPTSVGECPSVAAMVASVDKNLGQYPGTLSIQKKGKDEMVDDLKAMLESRLKLWQKHNNRLPDNIVVYRDGVSDGQFKIVLEKEVQQLRDACKCLYREDLPKLTVAVVGKRHNQRFYPTEKGPGNMDGSSNCLPGTVVDCGITEHRRWDFYLQAHASPQGTARPAHYIVIVDEIFRKDMKPEDLKDASNLFEEFTHNLSYTSVRATRATSIAPPAFYADRLCDRGKRYLGHLFEPTASESNAESNESGHGGEQVRSISVHEKLKDSMFYI